MNLDSDGMDDIISQESPLDMEGNYKKVRGVGGRVLLFVNNWTIFLTGRKIALEKWPNSTVSGHGHNIFRRAEMHRIEYIKLGKLNVFFLLFPACIHYYILAVTGIHMLLF